ncbi:MAG TPA: tetratricopeptide repeat protein [Methylomirabilota bacterium]|nr:tetratricopeptide repeat protein [Methylomirabilota bacterium]
MQRWLAAAVLLAAALAPLAALADPSPETVEQLRQAPATATPQTEYQRGVRARVTKDWTAAEAAFRAAIAQRPDYADAWNELGYALRHQRRYGDAVDAYREALRLRPNFPEALEYLGEAYVEMGRLDDARDVLGRLRLLDTGRAEELGEAIDKAR